MKSLLKILFPISIIVLIILILNIFTTPNQKKFSSPLNQENINQSIYSDFKKATHIFQINQDISQIEFKPYFYEIHFLINHNNYTTSVIFSTKKNIYSQVAILQKTLKIAKMKGNQVSFIDLSPSNPYAKLKNN